MRAIPGVFVFAVGLLVIVLRRVFAAGNDMGRRAVLGRASRRSESSMDAVMVLVIGAGLMVLGFWLAVWALIFR